MVLGSFCARSVHFTHFPHTCKDTCYHLLPADFSSVPVPDHDAAVTLCYYLAGASICLERFFSAVFVRLGVVCWLSVGCRGSVVSTCNVVAESFVIVFNINVEFPFYSND
jgi:hypothetical protein